MPDLPDCVAVASMGRGRDADAEAIALHMESLQEHGDPVPSLDRDRSTSHLLRWRRVTAGAGGAENPSIFKTQRPSGS